MADLPGKPRTALANGRWWGDQASDWAEIQEEQFAPGYQAAFEAAALEAGQSYGDIGCGAGLAAHLAAARGAQISGIDASAELLAIVRARVPGADFRLGEMEELPIPDAALDVVTGFNSFQYDNPVTVLAEDRRVTRAREHSGAAGVERAHAAALAPFPHADGSCRIATVLRWLLSAP